MPKSPPLKPADFVNAISQHVSSVCIITTEFDGDRFGLTATAVASVCAEPPRLLACVNRSGITHDQIISSGCFAVNVLAEEQERTAMVFAGMGGPSVERFDSGEWNTLATGAPILQAACANFDCQIHETMEQSTHTILIGNVVATDTKPGSEALLYGGRRFRQLRKVFSDRAKATDGYL